MQVKHYHSISSFLQDNLSFLEQKEAVNNLLIGIPMSMIGEEEKTALPNLFSVFKNGEIIFSFVQTSPKNFLIYGEQLPLIEAALEALIPELVKNKIQGEGVIGPKQLSIAFAECWKKHTAQDWRVNFQQLIYQLDEVKVPSKSKGILRKATLADLSIVTEWVFDFSKEVMSLSPSKSELAIATRTKIESNTLFLWEDGEIVSMTGVARPSRNGITINYVYTPLKHRGHGYASNCVAEVSKLMLEQYQFCCLFTDATNPTSNRIYQNIGYYPIEEFRELKFIL